MSDRVLIGRLFLSPREIRRTTTSLTPCRTGARSEAGESRQWTSASDSETVVPGIDRLPCGSIPVRRFGGEFAKRVRCYLDPEAPRSNGVPDGSPTIIGPGQGK